MYVQNLEKLGLRLDSRMKEQEAKKNMPQNPGLRQVCKVRAARHPYVWEVQEEGTRCLLKDCQNSTQNITNRALPLTHIVSQVINTLSCG